MSRRRFSFELSDYIDIDPCGPVRVYMVDELNLPPGVSLEVTAFTSSPIDAAIHEDLARQLRALAKQSGPGTFPRVASYLFPSDIHDRIWTPAVEDQKREYYEARQNCRTRPARIRLRAAFVVRTVIMVLDCYWLTGFTRVTTLLGFIIPHSIKRWWFDR